MEARKSVIPQRAQRDEKATFFESEVFQHTYPNLFELLALPEAYGKPREPSSVKVFSHEGKLKCCITDPSSRSIAFFTLDPEKHLWTQLEAALTRGEVDWREMKDQGKRKPPF